MISIEPQQGLNSFIKLTLKPSSQHIIQLLNHIEQKGGVLVHCSGHGKKDGVELKGTLTYHLGLSSGVMIALNKTLPSLYIKQFLPNGADIFALVPLAKTCLSKVYKTSNRGKSSKGYNTHLDKFDWLNPNHENPSILLQKIDIELAKEIVNAYLE